MGRERSRAAFDRWARFAGSRAAPVVLFCWAAAEATVWPILADVLLVPLALAAPHRLRMLLAAVVAGMAVGGVVSVTVASVAPGFALDVVHALPLLSDAQLARASRLLDAHGAAAFLVQPVSGSPFKAWAALAGDKGLSPAVVIPAFILARAARMAAVGTLAAVAGRRLRGWVRDAFVPLAVLYVAAVAVGLAQTMR